MNPMKNKTIPPNATPYASNIVHGLPKSEHYRYPLENLIGTEVVLEGTISSTRMSMISGFGMVTFLCLQKFHVKNGSTTIGYVDRQAIIDHMWIICDEDYVVRNDLKIGELVRCKGILYEYTKNGTDRNISMILKKTERVTATNRDLLKLNKIQGATGENAREIALIQSIAEDAKAKKNRRKMKKRLEHEVLQCLESFIEEQHIYEFCDLSREVRMANPEWYHVLVENADYLQNFISSISRKSTDGESAEAFLKKYRNFTVDSINADTSVSYKADNFSDVKASNDKPDKKYAVVGGTRYDLNNTGDEVAYKGKLNGIVNTFINNNVTCKSPHSQTYIVADSCKLVGVISASRTPLSLRHMDNLQDKFSYIDVCYFQNGSFEYHHYQRDMG